MMRGKRSLRAVLAAALCLGPCALVACSSSAPDATSSATAVGVVTPPRTVMVVGDSITQGLEGDVTWRYDLAKVEAKVPGFSYVGPWTGTYKLPARLPAGWPKVVAPPFYDGAYAPGEVFPDGGDDRHDSRWGETLAEGTSTIQATVRKYRPSYLLVMLGWDDLGWGTRSPDQVEALAGKFVNQARAADPSIRILFANAVQRAPISTAPLMSATIRSYDNALVGVLGNLTMVQSPVRLVDVADAYQPATDTYDGLHPDNLGEWVIADAFANVLKHAFGFGPGSTYRPAAEQLVKIAPAAKPTLTPDSAGIRAAWPHVFGAAGYYLEVADVTAGQKLGPGTEWTSQIVADSWQLTGLIPGNRYEVAVQAVRGYQVTPFSKPAEATAPRAHSS